MPPRILKGRKLLVASLGVASVSYVTGCSAFSDHDSNPTSGNLVAPPFIDRVLPPAPPPTSGNLVAPPEVPPPPPPAMDAGLPPTSGNLVPPPVPEEDAGVDADAG